jgi:hypothetical protein
MQVKANFYRKENMEAEFRNEMLKKETGKLSNRNFCLNLEISGNQRIEQTSVEHDSYKIYKQDITVFQLFKLSIEKRMKMSNKIILTKY